MQKASLGLNARHKVLYNVPENLFIIHRFIEEKGLAPKKDSSSSNRISAELRHFNSKVPTLQMLSCHLTMATTNSVFCHL